MGIAYGVGSLVVAAYSANEQSKNQKEAIAENRKQAEKTAALADEANNKANQKRSNASALLSSNQAAGKGGQSGTLLTGPGGVSTNSLSLGKTTLLGGGG